MREVHIVTFAAHKIIRALDTREAAETLMTDLLVDADWGDVEVISVPINETVGLVDYLYLRIDRAKPFVSVTRKRTLPEAEPDFVYSENDESVFYNPSVLAYGTDTGRVQGAFIEGVTRLFSKRSIPIPDFDFVAMS